MSLIRIKLEGFLVLILYIYTQTISKVGFGQRESFRNSPILNDLILENMRSFKIGKLRCFGTAENPTYEVA